MVLEFGCWLGLRRPAFPPLPGSIPGLRSAGGPSGPGCLGHIPPGFSLVKTP